MTPIVAIVGRANVGKSTLFNRLIGERRAVLSYEPGTTRDFLVGEVTWRRKTFTVVDTAGLFFVGGQQDKELRQGILEQTRAALAGADLILLMTSVREGLNPQDIEAARLIRRFNKPVFLLANKAESKHQVASNLPDLFKLGLGEPLPISALEGRGVGDLLDLIVQRLRSVRKGVAVKRPPVGTRIAILGKPNVGKSTLFNRLIGKKRSLVGQLPGTTRDLINETVSFGRERFTFLDTAGLRRKGKIETGPELFASLRSLRAIKEADICLLLVDAHGFDKLISQQDKQILNYILKEGKSAILIVNKWDLVEGEKKDTPLWEREIRRLFHFVRFLPILFVSAATGQRVEKIFSMIAQVKRAREMKFSVKQLAELIQSITLKIKPAVGRRAAKIRSLKQVGFNPPTFQLAADREPDESYLRYLENRLREQLDPLIGTPIRFKSFTRGGF